MWFFPLYCLPKGCRTTEDAIPFLSFSLTWNKFYQIKEGENLKEQEMDNIVPFLTKYLFLNTCIPSTFSQHH